MPCFLTSPSQLVDRAAHAATALIQDVSVHQSICHLPLMIFHPAILDLALPVSVAVLRQEVKDRVQLFQNYTDRNNLFRYLFSPCNRFSN